ncbi:MAG: DUF1772 domain-containing protein [Chloroflexi bacterium]|nr:DUF1772 domain-containing protein [Chloroflexota bacterium]
MIVTLLTALAGLLSALFAGFALAMGTVINGMLGDLPPEQYLSTMRGIITHGRTSVTVSGLVVGPVSLGIFLLLLRLPAIDTPGFVLSAGGTAAHLTGALLVSRFVAEPLYDTIMAWDTPPTDWPDYRRRWARINLIRALLPLLGAGLFFAAVLISQ